MDITYVCNIYSKIEDFIVNKNVYKVIKKINVEISFLNLGCVLIKVFINRQHILRALMIFQLMTFTVVSHSSGPCFFFVFFFILTILVFLHLTPNGSYSQRMNTFIIFPTHNLSPI